MSIQRWLGGRTLWEIRISSSHLFIGYKMKVFVHLPSWVDSILFALSEVFTALQLDQKRLLKSVIVADTYHFAPFAVNWLELSALDEVMTFAAISEKRRQNQKWPPPRRKKKSFDINLLSYCRERSEIFSNVWKLHKSIRGKRLDWRIEENRTQLLTTASWALDKKRYYERKSRFKYGFVTFQYGKGRFHLTYTKVTLWQKTRKN